MLRNVFRRHRRVDSSVLRVAGRVGCQIRSFSSGSANTNMHGAASPPRLKHRRKKVFRDRYQEINQQSASPLLAKPFDHSEPSVEAYLEKASLSPWVPTPDPLARRMLDLAKASSGDIHLELGSGDGRVNFHAIDAPYHVKKSVGIDIDRKLIETARERLSRIHPQPKIQFHEADLLDFDSSTAWDTAREATVITMYFTDEALQKLRPQLERCLQNRKVRVVTCGYAMPRWEPEWVEVILGLRLYSYHWGFTDDKLDEEMAPEGAGDMHEVDAQGGTAATSIAREDLEAAAFPSLAREFREAERIETTDFDPEEAVDFHWDDFDDEKDDWKPPEQ